VGSAQESSASLILSMFELSHPYLLVPLSRRGGRDGSQKLSTMAATLIEYEVFQVGPELKDVKKSLNDLGRRGFRVVHVRVGDTGVYTFILCKDTGRNPEGEEVPAGGEWIDDGFVNEETSWT
jgi:hypothetical protein